MRQNEYLWSKGFKNVGGNVFFFLVLQYIFLTAAGTLKSVFHDDGLGIMPHAYAKHKLIFQNTSTFTSDAEGVIANNKTLTKKYKTTYIT